MADASFPLPGIRLPKREEDRPVAGDDPSDSRPLSEKKYIILEIVASSTLLVELVDVISARVSRKVFASLVQAGPISCKIFEIPAAESGPSDGDKLFATPEAILPRDLMLLSVVLSKLIFKSSLRFLRLRRTASKFWMLFDLINV